MAQTLARIASLTDQLIQWLDDSLPGSSRVKLLDRLGEEILSRTKRACSPSELRTTLAQLLVQVRVQWDQSDPALHRAALACDIFPRADTLFGQLLRMSLPPGPWKNDLDPTLVPEHLLGTWGGRAPMPTALRSSRARANGVEYDSWLGSHDRKRRAHYGVYYTPRVIAAYMVREIDRTLRREFGLADGLADTASWQQVAERHPGSTRGATVPQGTRFVRVLDPATGGGVFLVEVMERVHETMLRKWSQEGLSPPEQAQAWNQYVQKHLLPHTAGIELQLPQAATAWLRIAECLAMTGYSFRRSPPIPIMLADTLETPEPGQLLPLGAASKTASPCVEPIAPFTVVLGNPPFAALTATTNSWMNELLRVREVAGRTIGSYYEVDGGPLGERKLWLHDDYVKFLRYAQCHIEQAGCGVLAFVTNHGYLDNVTFRGLRRSLLNTFPRISLLDLHGNRKKREVAPSAAEGDGDENVFDIHQGIAIGLLRKPPVSQPPQVGYQELWGSRANKLQRLGDGAAELPTSSVTPLPPYYFFVPMNSEPGRREEYERGLPLPAIMPLYSSAAVTARDNFVIAFTAEELLERLVAFADSQLDHQDIRQRFFQRTRSRRYQTGDTRGWKLEVARGHAQAAGDLRGIIRTCQYRPFDQRFIAWADWLIDWPRQKVMRHLLGAENLALVTRRQMLPGQPCNYFFLSDTVVVDGLIRSDNRGNESFFPLYLTEPGEVPSGRLPRCNFTDAFARQCVAVSALQWIDYGRGDLRSTFGPADLFALIYAQFYSETYRKRYADWIRLSFPRVFVPRRAELFRHLCRLGHDLISAHRLMQPTDAEPIDKGPSGVERSRLSRELVLEGKHPTHAGTTVHLAQDCSMEGVAPQVWEYCIGGHQVCRKWLRERHGRRLTAEDLATFHTIVARVARTLRCSAEIDEAIQSAGGWPGAFL